MFPNASRNSSPGTRGPSHNLRRKPPPINLVENPEALGFHQETTKDPIEQMETTEDSTDISGLVLYQTLFYLLEKLLQVSVTIQKFKIQDVILMCLEILLSKHNI